MGKDADWQETGNHPVSATAGQFAMAFTAIGVRGAVVMVFGAVAMRKKQ
jgi:hypothetical protein